MLEAHDASERLLPASDTWMDSSSPSVLHGATSPSSSRKSGQLELAAAIVALSSFLWGYGVAVLNVCLVPNAAGSILVDINLSTSEQETATALVLVGALFSALLSSGIADRLGRKKTILLNNVFFILGGALCTIATTKNMLFAGRFFIGVACGIVTNTVPILLNEIAPVFASGQVTSYHQLYLTLGMLTSGVLGFLVITDVPSGWRYLNAVILIPSTLQILATTCISESPWWLMKHRGWDASREALEFLRPTGRAEMIQDELEEIAKSMADRDDEKPASWRDLRKHKRIVLMGTLLVFFQAMTGINTVMLYSAQIFHFAGVDNPFLATAVVGVVNVIVTIASTRLVDRFGRRPLLLVGTSIMILALVTLSISLLYLDKMPGVQGAFAVSAVLVFVAGFAVGLGAVVWVVLADITPVQVRSKAFSMFMAVNYICNIAIAVGTLSAIDALGRGEEREKNGIAKLYLILAAIAFVCVSYVLLKVPETKRSGPKSRRNLEEDEKSLLSITEEEEDSIAASDVTDL